MNRTSDIVIIGGGVIGTSVAYALSSRGVSVTLIDKSMPGRATSASAGGLWPIGEAIGLGCGVIFHATHHPDGGDHPEPLPRCFMDFLCASNERFPRLAAELRDLSGIDIEAEQGTGLLYLLYTDHDERYADGLLAWMDEGGATSAMATRLTPEEAFEQEPMLTREIRGAVYFPGDNQVNPMFLAEALKRSACRQGAKFIPETSVTGIRLKKGRILAVETSTGTFPCAGVVNAAGAWSRQLADMVGLDLPVFPVRGQIVCTETLRAGSLRRNLSTGDCYLLQKAHGEVIIGSTTEHSEFDTSVRLDNLKSLAAGGIRAVPALRQATVKRTWAGLRPGSPDEFPILGPVPSLDNYFNATGGFRTGIVAAPLTGEIVASFVTGESQPYPSDPFLYSRFEATRQVQESEGQSRVVPAGGSLSP